MEQIGILSQLALKYGSDKWGSHSYTEHYDRRFSFFRDQPVKVLELGIGGYDDPMRGGASLKMWRDYFQRGTIFGLDVFDKTPHADDRIRVYQGSQTDPEILLRMNEEAGGFDIIIDDGSHFNSHVISSFTILFPVLKKNGIYAVEDTQTSYWPLLGGSNTDLQRAESSLGYFQSLIPGLNYQEIHRPGYSPTLFDETIVSMEFLHNMIFIQKGDNSEKSILLENYTIPEEYLQQR